MAQIVLAPWEWVEEPEGGAAWTRRGAIGRLDLRSYAACAQPGGTPQGYGLFVFEEPNAGLSKFVLADSLDAKLTATQLEAIEKALKCGRLTKDRVLDILVELLSTHADPTQVDRTSCLMPKQNGMMEVWLAREKVWERRFNGEADPAWPNIQQVVQATYRETRERALAEAALLRSLESPIEYPYGSVKSRYQARIYKLITAFNKGFDELKEDLAKQAEVLHRKRLTDWQGKFGISDYTKFIPDDLPTETPRPRATTITDDFNRDNSDDLGSSSEGWSWTEVSDAADFAIVDNKAKSGPGSLFRVFARAESDLSSDDHYAQASITLHEPSAGWMGVRCDSGAWNYYGGCPNYYYDEDRIYKIAASTPTELTSQAHTLEPDVAYVVNMEADGSTLTVVVDGYTPLVTTDATYTGQTRGGIGAYVGGAENYILWDDFVGADLGAPPAGAVGLMLKETELGNSLFGGLIHVG